MKVNEKKVKKDEGKRKNEMKYEEKVKERDEMKMKK